MAQSRLGEKVRGYGKSEWQGRGQAPLDQSNEEPFERQSIVDDEAILMPVEMDHGIFSASGKSSRRSSVRTDSKHKRTPFLNKGYTHLESSTCQGEDARSPTWSSTEKKHVVAHVATCGAEKREDASALAQPEFDDSGAMVVKCPASPKPASSFCRRQGRIIRAEPQ